MGSQEKSASENATRYVLTVRLTFSDRIDADDAVDTMESCITDALSLESSIEEI